MRLHADFFDRRRFFCEGTGSYYVEIKHGAPARETDGRSYDSAEFTTEGGESDFRRCLVSRLANEVRTANSTGDIQALRAQVSAGTYTPDCMAIAGRLLYMAGE